MFRSFLTQTMLGGAVLLAGVMLSSTAWSQHGGGGHGGGGHGGGSHGGGGGHGGGGHGGFGGHGGGGHRGFGGHGSSRHGYSGHVSSRHGYSGHISSGHGSSGYGYSHYGYGHGYGGHGYGYYDHYPYYDWYPSFGASLYPWYGYYGTGDYVVVNRPVIVEDQTAHEHVSTSTVESGAPSPSIVTAQGLQYQRRAESAFRRGRYDQALRLANHALVEMPRNGKLLLFVAQGLFATGDYQGAAAAIHQASAILDKDDWGSAVKNWRKYYGGKAYDAAMEKLNEYIKKNPEAAYARFVRGYHYGFLDHKEFARKELTKVIQLENQDFLAVELLKMFGGKPPAGTADPSDANQTSSGPDSAQGQAKGEDELSHGPDNEAAEEPATVGGADG